MKQLSTTPNLAPEEKEEAFKYFHDPEIIKLIGEYNEKYLHWEEIKRRKDQERNLYSSQIKNAAVYITHKTKNIQYR